MRLTRAGEYAIRCILYLARNGKGMLVSRQEIAEQADVPSHFLAKIAQQLARSSIIEIQQGARGGYILLKDPARLTMLEVIEAIIGEISLNDCVGRPDSCRNSPTCVVHRVWCTANDQLRTTLGQVSFADLLEDEECCIVPTRSRVEAQAT
jgi:Rrf2 family iron-sulfur cluster assembly transcriptional regulator